jgi:hypothetical protein
MHNVKAWLCFACCWFYTELNVQQNAIILLSNTPAARHKAKPLFFRDKDKGTHIGKLTQQLRAAKTAL